MRQLACLVCGGLLALAVPAGAQQVDAIEHRLDNGLTLLLVPRPGDPNVAAGWVAKVGSVYERPGITGVAHLFEHMMFKGTHTIGTQDIEEDLQIIEAARCRCKADLQIEEGDARLQAASSWARSTILSRPGDAPLPETCRRCSERVRRRFSRGRVELLIKEDFSRIYTAQGGVRHERHDELRLHHVFR